MKNYSRQLDKFIESTIYATSAFKSTDGRTWVSYYKDNNNLIHSSSFNYSIIGGSPVTIEEFKKCIEKNSDTKITLN